MTDKLPTIYQVTCNNGIWWYNQHIIDIPVSNRWLNNGNKNLGSNISLLCPWSWLVAGWSKKEETAIYGNSLYSHTSSDRSIGNSRIDCFSTFLSNISSTSAIPGCLHNTHPFFCLSLNWLTAVLPHKYGLWEQMTGKLNSNYEYDHLNSAVSIPCVSYCCIKHRICWSEWLNTKYNIFTLLLPG